MSIRKTHNVSLTPELEAVIDRRVVVGRYCSAREVVRAALRLLENTETIPRRAEPGCAGVTPHRVGGHTAGLQMVRVETARGAVVLASDAAHYYANLERENPFPIVFDLGQMAQGWRSARRLASDESRIVPGHDPEVMRRYPALQGAEGYAACLHLAPLA